MTSYYKEVQYTIIYVAEEDKFLFLQDDDYVTISVPGGIFMEIVDWLEMLGSQSSTPACHGLTLAVFPLLNMTGVVTQGDGPHFMVVASSTTSEWPNVIKGLVDAGRDIYKARLTRLGLPTEQTKHDDIAKKLLDEG